MLGKVQQRFNKTDLREHQLIYIYENIYVYKANSLYK